MIDNELLFLGLLANGPKHGYDIKRQLEEELLPTIGLQIKSIYYPLKKMEEAGLIEKETGREGRFPEKYIYRITAKGKSHLDHLLEQSFLSIERPFFQINLSLYFLPLVDKSLAKRRLKTRIAFLKKIHKEMAALAQNAKSPAQALILGHDLDLVSAEIASSERIIQQI